MPTIMLELPLSERSARTAGETEHQQGRLPRVGPLCIDYALCKLAPAHMLNREGSHGFKLDARPASLLGRHPRVAPVQPLSRLRARLRAALEAGSEQALRSGDRDSRQAAPAADPGGYSPAEIRLIRGSKAAGALAAT